MFSNQVCPHCGKVHTAGARFCPTTGKSTGPQGIQPLPAHGLTGMLPPNSFLKNRYLIIQKVGQGGMAAVYKAADTLQPGVTWAIKEMSDATITNPQDRPQAIQRFQQEASLLQTLNHPNLPKVVDFFMENGKHYLVMEFVPGCTLEEMLANRGPIPEAEVRSWALQLCQVLSFLHNQPQKIIFRDLKPGNIMLTPQGQIKLIDFGIVRYFKPGKVKDTEALGTLGYAAPEAARIQTDPRSDVFSLCVTLHQLLTGMDPSQTPYNLPPVRKISSAVSVEMEQIILKGMQVQADLRFGSMDELRSEISKVRPGISGGNQSGFGSTSGQGQRQGQIRTSRPTTRLIMAAAQLSGKQLGAILGGVTLALVLLTWQLAPVLATVPFNWNRVPVTAIFGALGYAAFPRRGVTFFSHFLLSFALAATVWLRLGYQGFSWFDLLIAAILSGAAIEGWSMLLPKVKGRGGADAWKVEVGWLAGMGIIGTIFFFGISTRWDSGLDLLQWFFAALLGAAGWFLGDMVRQFMLFKQTGLRRIT